jgi:hypothetical protein
MMRPTLYRAADPENLGLARVSGRSWFHQRRNTPPTRQRAAEAALVRPPFDGSASARDYGATEAAAASGAAGAGRFATAALRAADGDPAFLRPGTTFFAAAFFAAKAGVDPAAAFFGPVDFFTAFAAPAALVVPPFVAGDLFTGDWITCAGGAPAAAATGTFAATFFLAVFTGVFAAPVGAATAASADGFAASAISFDLPFAGAAGLMRLGAIDSSATVFAGDGATDATVSGAGTGGAPTAKLSSVRPAAMALRSQAGRGPRPPHWLPFPSLNLAPLAAVPLLPFVTLVFFEAKGDTADAEVEVNFRSSAVRLYFEIMSLIFAIAPLASSASCFCAEAWRAAISRANCA